MTLQRASVSRETTERLDLLAGLLASWNPTIRLVAAAERDEVWRRHIEDSLQLMPLIEQADGAAADVGSGAGFPGLVLAIALGRHFHLIEADQRKAAFLTEAARVTGADVTVMPCRVEVAGIRCRLLTARAFASVGNTLKAVFALLEPGAVCLLPKGRNAAAELDAASSEWRMRVERFASVTDQDSTILRLSEITHA